MLPRQHLHLSASNVMLTQTEEESSQPKSRANCGTCSSEQLISTDFSIHCSVSLNFSRILFISKQQGKGEEKAVMKANSYNHDALSGSSRRMQSWLKAECLCERGDQASGPTQVETKSLAFLLAVGSFDRVELQMRMFSCLGSSCPLCFCPTPANTFLSKKMFPPSHQ